MSIRKESLISTYGSGMPFAVSKCNIPESICRVHMSYLSLSCVSIGQFAVGRDRNYRNYSRLSFFVTFIIFTSICTLENFIAVVHTNVSNVSCALILKQLAKISLLYLLSRIHRTYSKRRRFLKFLLGL